MENVQGLMIGRIWKRPRGPPGAVLELRIQRVEGVKIPCPIIQSKDIRSLFISTDGSGQYAYVSFYDPWSAGEMATLARLIVGAGRGQRVRYRDGDEPICAYPTVLSGARPRASHPTRASWEAASLSCPDGLIFTAKTVRTSPAPETPTMLDAWNGEALLTTHQAAALLGLLSRTL